MSKYYLLLGGNEGNVSQTMSAAVSRIAETGHILAQSQTYQSPPWGYESNLPYLNMVVVVLSDINPFSMLSFLKHVERELGRLTKSSDGNYSDRPIDIDILLCDGQTVNTDVLQIPHPRLHLRRFALTPLAEVAQDLLHPTLRKTISQLLTDCTDSSNVKPIKTNI